MKKSSRFLAVICVPVLASCLSLLSGCSKQGKVGLVYGDYRNTTVTKISYEELTSKVSEEQNFLLAIEPSTYCACWRDFKLIADSYIKNNHVIIYYLAINEFGENKFGLSLKEGYTSFAIFENGKVRFDVASDNGQTLKDTESFNSYMSECVTMPTMFYISRDELEKIYSSEKYSTVYFARSNCPDCTFADRTILKKYSLSHRDANKLFILDCESIGIRQYDESGKLTPESQIAWQLFKDTYGLSDSLNTKYGYGTGYVPTFLLLNKNEYKSGAVYFNDSIVENEGTYKVESSYYSGNRMPNLQYLTSSDSPIQGRTISSDDVGRIGDYVYWKAESAAKFHDTYLEKFLNFALPYVNYKVG